MESLGKIDGWILNNSNLLNLQVRIFENDLLAHFGINDIDVTVTINGKTIAGRGTDFDQNIALKKALSEAIERYFLSTNRFPTSNGMAAHTSIPLATNSAKSELIERDLFFCHFLTGTPFFEIFPSDKYLIPVKEHLNKSNVSIQFYSLGNIGHTECILCSISGLMCNNPFGYIFGTAAGAFNDSVRSSFLEAIRNFANLKIENSISLKDFDLIAKSRHIQFEEHGNLALDVEYAQIFQEIFFPQNVSQKPAQNASVLDNIIVDNIDTKGSLFEDSPFVVVRAHSDLLQDLFLGCTTTSVLNIPRLSQFCEARGIEFSIFDRIPHPFN